MKNKRKALRRLPIGVSFGLPVYAGTLLLLIILAQTLPVPFTHALVLLCLYMPIPSVLILLMSMPFLSVGARVGTATAVRNEKCSMCVNIKNSSLLPISVAEVICRVPDEKDGSGAAYLKQKITLAPLSLVTVTAEPVARRRGRFEVGVKEIWVCDLLRLVKIRKRLNGAYTLAVMPILPNGQTGLYDDGITEDDSAVTVDVFSSYDYSDVREYRAGDSMKRVHWKLYAKSDDLQVRKSVEQNQSYTCIVCDRSVDGSLYNLSRGAQNELDDRTVEEAMLAVSEICRRDESGCLAVGTDDGCALRLDFGGISDEAEMRYLLSGLERGDGADLTSLIPESATAVYYIISYLSPDRARGVFDVHKSCVSQAFNVCIRDVTAFIPEDRREDYRASLQQFQALLAENSISFFTVTEGGHTNEEKE